MEDFDFDDVFPDLGDGFDLDMTDPFSDGLESRYIKPCVKQMKDSQVTYSNAVKLAKDITIGKGERYDVIVSGDFIFGDFIEAYFTTHNCRCPKMIISTLSLSQNNVDSLKNLLVGGYIGQLDIVISHYFYSNERLALIPYMYQELDFDNRFQLSVASIHTKTAQFEVGDRKILIHGSANLRSNGNIEQFTIEENAALYDFYAEVFEKIKERYKTINRAVRKGLFELISE